MKRLSSTHAVVAAAVAALAAGALLYSSRRPVAITVDYPLKESIFPPEFPAPHLEWRDGKPGARSGRSTSPSAMAPSHRCGRHRGCTDRVGKIDARRWQDEQAAEADGRTGRGPHLEADPAKWAAIKKRSVGSVAELTITGFPDEGHRLPCRAAGHHPHLERPRRRAHLLPRRAADALGDREGRHQAAGPEDVPLIAWRLRNVGETSSRAVMTGSTPARTATRSRATARRWAWTWTVRRTTRACTPSFSIQPQASIRDENVIEWSSFRGKLGGKLRVGFMSQVSPTGSTWSPPSTIPAGPRPTTRAASCRRPRGNYYVANFKDYRFLQVFYPPAASWPGTAATTGKLQPLPGRRRPALRADQRRLEPRRQVPRLRPRARRETPTPRRKAGRTRQRSQRNAQIQYDLYRIPFNGGKGGQRRTDRRRLAQRHEQQLPQGLARRPLDRLRAGAQRPADASRQPALHRPGRGRRGAADALQHAADELLAQLLAQRPLAGVLLQEPLALHPDVPHAHRRSRATTARPS